MMGWCRSPKCAWLGSSPWGRAVQLGLIPVPGAVCKVGRDRGSGDRHCCIPFGGLSCCPWGLQCFEPEAEQRPCEIAGSPCPCRQIQPELRRVCSHALPYTWQTCLFRNGKYFPKACKNALRLLAIWLSCIYLVDFSLLLFITFGPHWGISFFFFLFLFLVLTLGWGTLIGWKWGWKEKTGLGIPALLPPVPLTRSSSLT